VECVSSTTDKYDAAFVGVVETGSCLFLPLTQVSTFHSTIMHISVRLAGNFDPDLQHWNTESVTDMSRMVRPVLLPSTLSAAQGHIDLTSFDSIYHKQFLNCFSFEGRGLEQWNTSRVEDMSLMVSKFAVSNGLYFILWWVCGSAASPSCRSHLRSSSLPMRHPSTGTSALLMSQMYNRLE